MAELYDSIADDYQSFYDLPAAEHLEMHTFLGLVGDIPGQLVLDLACGEGVYTRSLLACGAASALGVDISPRMIELAREKETNRPTGARYEVADARTMGRMGQFDLVSACYLLNYAASDNDLLAMCRTIAANLHPGGRFAGLVTNLHADPEHYDAFVKYGFGMTAAAPLKNGDEITITLHLAGTGTAKKLVKFPNYYLSSETYDWAFREAGLSDVTRHRPIVSREGIDRFGAEFWADAQRYPWIFGVTARKE